MNITLLIVLPIASALLVAIYFISKHSALRNSFQKELQYTENNAVLKLNTTQNEVSLLQERLNHFQFQQTKMNEEYQDLQNNYRGIQEQNAKVWAENKVLKEKTESMAVEFERLQKQATTEFENIANKILKKNTEDFNSVNHTKIDELIKPLKEKIQSFEKKVEDTYEKGLKDQTDLKAELKKLHELNNKISTEANNLTKALKGDVKQQGNWGEFVLERILERSGLTKDREFTREEVALNAEGKTIRPDVIIHLPDKKHIIVDSKVSLIAYERFVNAEEKHQREQFLKEHLISVKKHVKELNEKHYSSSPQFNSPDFVLLFIPIESSFSLAVEQDQQLFNFAWDNKVVIVSPSTLLATLRTIASIWQQENQTRNAMEIAKQSGALYDKFVGFITDIDKLGKNLDTLQKTYNEASKKLYTGSGNLVRRVENLKALGASTSKEIPDSFKN